MKVKRKVCCARVRQELYVYDMKTIALSVTCGNVWVRTVEGVMVF